MRWIFVLLRVHVETSVINYTTESIWNTPATYIVVPVNCVGVAGAGVAKEFKRRYPEAHNHYVDYCREGLIVTGDAWWCGGTNEIKKICLFPTKQHWKDPSELEWIDLGLQSFVRKIKDVIYNRRGFAIDKPCEQSYAFPKLGCGLGGLDWHSQVEPLMNKHLGYLKNQIYFHV